MNHYPRHVGDWITATAHLTEIEECIYSRMLDQYYAREAPLPVEIDAVSRLVRASNTIARKAVKTILGEFFRLEADGWHQTRCDEEISAFQAKSAAASASAAARWKSRNANAYANASPIADPNAYANASDPHSVGNANQNQNQNQGLTVPQGRTGAGEAETGESGKPMGDRSPGKATAKPNGSGWWKTPQGVESQGKKLGIPAKPGETFPEYKQRLFSATYPGTPVP